MKKEMTGWQWHQLDHMQIICISLQTDNHASTSSVNYYTGWMFLLTPNQQCQCTDKTCTSELQSFSLKQVEDENQGGTG